MSNYSKLIGAVTGNVVAIIVAWLASKFPGIAECLPGADNTEVCTVLGFSQTQVTAALMMIFNAAFVYASPANKPT